jgi:hypothetical protein
MPTPKQLRKFTETDQPPRSYYLDGRYPVVICQYPLEDDVTNLVEECIKRFPHIFTDVQIQEVSIKVVTDEHIRTFGRLVTSFERSSIEQTQFVGETEQEQAKAMRERGPMSESHLVATTFLQLLLSWEGATQRSFDTFEQVVALARLRTNQLGAPYLAPDPD